MGKNVKQFRSMQAYEVDCKNGVVFVSYYTPIMVLKNNVIYEVDKKFSVTTSKQCTFYKRSKNMPQVVTVTSDKLKELLKDVGFNYSTGLL